METCDEKKKSMWHFICHGEFNQCIFCGQSVCIYHGASNNGGFQGGHSGCSVACDTSYSWLCQGHMTKCELCNKPHCSYHSSIHRCTFCPYQFCEYHYHPNSHALETGGGHVCPSVTTGAAVATAVGNAAYYSAGAAAITTFAVATGGQGVVLAGAALGGAVAGAGAKQALNVVDCNTARHTAGMCEGISSVCQYCQNSYCIYHLQAAEDLTDIVGGHCCEKFTANSKIGIAVGNTLAVGSHAVEAATAATGVVAGVATLNTLHGVRTVWTVSKGSLDAYSATKAAAAVKDFVVK